MNPSTPFGPHGDPWAYLDAPTQDGFFDALCEPAGNGGSQPRPGGATGQGPGAPWVEASLVGELPVQLPKVQHSLLRDIAAWGPVTDTFLSDLRVRRRDVQGVTRGSIRNHVMDLTQAGLISTTPTRRHGIVARFALPAGFDLAGMGGLPTPVVSGPGLRAQLGVLDVVSKWPREVETFARCEVASWDGDRDPISRRLLVHRISGLSQEAATWIPAAYGRLGDSAGAVMIADGRPLVSLINDLRIVLEASGLEQIVIVTTEPGQQFNIQGWLDANGLAQRCRVHAAG